MGIQILLIILGFILLIKGADVLVIGSENIAKKFHIPEIIIGLTIVSMGTSMPEMFVSITSSLNGSSDIAIGNIIGSNLCNLLLILGLVTIIRDVEFKRETRLIEIPLTLFATVVLLILCNIGLNISKVDAIILLMLFILFLSYTVIMGKKGEKFDEEDLVLDKVDKDITINEETKNKNKIKKEEKTKKIFESIIYILIGIICLKFGGDFVVNNAQKIAITLNISEKIISLTIIAIGTSLPELVTSVVASIKGDSDIAIGNILGSNLFNILFVLGVSGIITPINYDITYNIQLILLIISTTILALFPFMGRKNQMTRVNGLIYLSIYIIYTLSLIIF